MNQGSIDHPSQVTIREIKPPEEFTEAALEGWISQLPLGDVDSAGVAVHGLLRAVNMADDLECGERIRIVEQIRPPTVSLVAMTSEKHLPSSTLFPLSLGARQHVQRGVEISQELASAYRRVVTSGGYFGEKLSDAGRAQIVYRALQAYGQALLRSLESYESPPEGFWREVFGFYRFAVGHRLHKLSLPTPEIEGATVDSQFKQMLLLALASHQHYLPDEIRQFYTALMLIAKDAEIDVEPAQGEEVAIFCFDLDSDNAPRPVKRAKPQVGERHYLYTAAMLEKARQYFINPIHRASERFKIKTEVLLRLLDTLNASEKRRYVRKSASGTRRFIVGLPRLLRELSGEPPPPEVAKPEPELALTPMVEDEEMEIVLDRAMSTEEEIWLRNTGGFMGAKTGLAKAPADLGSGELTGSLLNSSAGGYCMLWLNRQVSGARVGELIGIYEEENLIHVGVIRWLHHKARYDLVFGVELLSPMVEAVDIITGSASDSGQRGLYLSANQKLGQPASLLTSPGAFKPGHFVALRGKNGRQGYRLEDLLESTLSFQLFSLAEPG